MSQIGLDIGSKTIKIVELDKEAKGFRLKAAGVVGHNGKPIETMESEADFAALSQIVAKLHKETKIQGREISLALPEPQVFTRIIRFPMLTDQEISSSVKWEAEQYIPIPVNEAIVQHQIVERNERSIPPEVLVLLVAAPKTLVDKYIKIVQMAKLQVVQVETELMSLTRALAPIDQTALIIDFGAKSTDIAVSKKGQLFFSRSIPTAGDALTRAVAQSLGVEHGQAEQYKKTYGFSGSQLEGKVKGALDPVFAMIADEIKKAIHFYRSEEKGDVPKSVIVSGGTSGTPEAISILTGLLNMEVSVGNAFRKVILDEATSKSLAPYAPLYSVAVGLALK